MKKRRIFSSIGSYVTGSLDPGLFVVSGKLNEGVALENADLALWEVIDQLKEEHAVAEEVQKVKNQSETSLEFGDVELLNRAMNLALASLMGDPELVNLEKGKVNKVSALDIDQMANKILVKTNCSTLYYKSKSAA